MKNINNQRSVEQNVSQQCRPTYRHIFIASLSFSPMFFSLSPRPLSVALNDQVKHLDLVARAFHTEERAAHLPARRRYPGQGSVAAALRHVLQGRQAPLFLTPLPTAVNESPGNHEQKGRVSGTSDAESDAPGLASRGRRRTALRGRAVRSPARWRRFPAGGHPPEDLWTRGEPRA